MFGKGVARIRSALKRLMRLPDYEESSGRYQRLQRNLIVLEDTFTTAKCSGGEGLTAFFVSADLIRLEGSLHPILFTALTRIFTYSVCSIRLEII